MVKKNAFMLSSAELMLCKFGSKPVFDLTPDADGVGLANEIAINVDSSNIDLNAGVAQVLVDSHRTNVQSLITGSVREYTAENFLRAQGVAPGAGIQAMRGKLTAAAAAAAVSITFDSDPLPGEAASAMPATALPIGTTLLIQHATIPEIVFPVKISAASTVAAGEHTASIAAPYAIPAGMDFPIGSKVWVVQDIPVGSMDQGDLFSVKIVGTLANYNRPVMYVAPKVQITKGFNLSFTETEYGAMPWEMRGLLLSSSEATGRLATDIGTRAPGRLFAA